MCRVFSFLLLSAFFGLLISQQSTAQINPYGLDPSKPLKAYHITNISQKDGLASNAVNTITQDQQGFMWLVSYIGISKFDGVSYTNYHTQQVEQIKINNFFSITEDKRGDMWIGTHGSGVLSYKDGVLKSHYDKKLTDIQCLYVDSKDTLLWVGTRNQGLYVYNGINFVPYQHPLLDKATVTSVYKTPAKELWIATNGKGLLRCRDKNFTIYDIQHGLISNVIFSVKQDAQNNLWLGTNKGLMRFNPDSKEYKVISELDGKQVSDLIIDKFGSVWAATDAGLWRFNAYTQQMEQLTEKDGLAGSIPITLFFDREGNLWVGTYNNGVSIIKNILFDNYDLQNSTNLAIEIAPEQYLIASDKGLYEFNKGNVYEKELDKEFKTSRVKGLIKDNKQQLWMSFHNGSLVKYLPNQKQVIIDKKLLHDEQLRKLFKDKEGNIWVGSRNNGALKITPDNKYEVFNEQKGLSSNFVMDINQTSNGDMLFTSNRTGLTILKTDGQIEYINKEVGLDNAVSFRTYVDSAQTLWIASSMGLVCKKGTELTIFNLQKKIPNETIYDVIEDKDGFLWMPSPTCIIKVPKQDLIQHTKGGNHTIRWVSYEQNDGLLGECKGASFVMKDSRGMLWFPMNSGFTIVQPHRELKNTQIPPVWITKFTVNDSSIRLNKKDIILHAGSLRFRFDFTALSFVAPSKVKFLYQLEGFDKTWREGNTKDRFAEYTNLSYGTYTFKVKASNNDGLWNEKGATISFEVLPYWYQTFWAYLLVSVILVGAGVGINYLRTQRILAQNEKLEKIIKERTAELIIAKEDLEANLKISKTQQLLLEEQNQDILASIAVAKRIQQAILPTMADISSAIANSFVFYKPRDIVSGDFYWSSKVKKNGRTYVVLSVADCTGHGVPGAFLSMVGCNILNNLVIENKIIEPNRILALLDKEVRRTLKQEKGESIEGMEMAIITLQKETESSDTQHLFRQLDYAGAMNPLYYVQNGEMKELKATKLPIGGESLKEKEFMLHTLVLSDQPTMFYLCSDGYQDQFGGEQNKKFMTKKLRELLLQIHHLPTNKQLQILETTFYQWKGTQEQVDDVTVMGLLC